MEDTRQCCNPFPCPYIGRDKACEECNYYSDDYWGEDEIEHKCHNCARYLQGEYDGSCGSYICEKYSGWEGRK